MKNILLIFILNLTSFCFAQQNNWYIPVKTFDRKNTNTIHLTEIGKFGLLRKARPTVPAHLHTGIDIKRPSDNFSNEAVYPAADGIVISIRTDGPYAQIFIEHQLPDHSKVWTVYEHISGISVRVGDHVNPLQPIARFMNTEELNKYGWKFNHLHFEVIKLQPPKLKILPTNPFRFYNSYSLLCYTEKDLGKYYFDPTLFLKKNMGK